MKQETVFIKFKFKIEYDNKKCKSYLLERLVSNPCVSMAGAGRDGGYRYEHIGNGNVVKGRGRNETD